MYCADAVTIVPFGSSRSIRKKPSASIVKLVVNDPSASRASDRTVSSSITSWPAGVPIVGTARTRTSVPRRAATSPPFSIVRGGSPV